MRKTKPERHCGVQIAIGIATKQSGMAGKVRPHYATDGISFNIIPDCFNFYHVYFFSCG
jgi:hypothetical protein